MLAPDWRKATYSNSFSNCVEARWRKSSHSGPTGCTEARTAGGMVQVRDSKDPGPVLSFTPAEWDAFLSGIKA